MVPRSGKCRNCGRDYKHLSSGRCRPCRVHWDTHTLERPQGPVASRKPWTEADEDALRRAYSQPHPELHALAVSLGRTIYFLSRKAGELGLTRRGRKHSLDTKVRHSETRRLRHAFGVDVPASTKGTKRTPEQRAILSLRRRPTPPPFTQARRMALSAGMQKRLRGTNVYSSAKRGRRADLGGRFFRSAWEANYARYLNWLQANGKILGWEYEPHTFWFEKIRRGVRSYTPDFKILESSGHRWVEVKGYMDPKSKTKLKRMKKYHPTERIEVVGPKEYKGIATSIGCGLPGWEK